MFCESLLFTISRSDFSFTIVTHVRCLRHHGKEIHQRWVNWMFDWLIDEWWVMSDSYTYILLLVFISHMFLAVLQHTPAACLDDIWSCRYAANLIWIDKNCFVHIYTDQLRSKLRSFTNCSPCRGFVRISAIISVVGRYIISISPNSTLFLVQKWRMDTCLVWSEEACPLVERAIVDWLSW